MLLNVQAMEALEVFSRNRSEAMLQVRVDQNGQEVEEKVFRGVDQVHTILSPSPSPSPSPSFSFEAISDHLWSYHNMAYYSQVKFVGSNILISL